MIGVIGYFYCCNYRNPARGASAADLKFLQHLQQAQLRNFKSKSGTRIIELLVPLCFRSSCQRVLRCITNFGSGALVQSRCFIRRHERIAATGQVARRSRNTAR